MNDAGQGQNASGSWRPDPTGRYKLRWSDSVGNWTDHVYSNEGEMGNDPYVDSPPSPPPMPPDSIPEQPRPSLLDRHKAVYEEREAQRKAKYSAKKAELQQRLADQKAQKKCNARQ